MRKLTQPVAYLRSSHGVERNLTLAVSTEKAHLGTFSLQEPVFFEETVLRSGSLVGGAGFEPATPWMSTKYSNQLN
jgi:hypothetical protein